MPPDINVEHRYPSALEFVQRHGPETVAVLHDLLVHARSGGGELVVEASARQIAERLGFISKDTVHRRLRQLLAAGVLHPVSHRQRSRFTRRAYWIDLTGTGISVERNTRSPMSASPADTRRECLRAVGPVAWVLLEELSLRAQRDSHGRTATTNTTDLAEAIGVGADAVSRGLRRLRQRGLLSIDAVRDDSGRFVASRYKLLADVSNLDTPALVIAASTEAGETVSGNVESGENGNAPTRTRQRRRPPNANPTRNPSRDHQLSIFNTDPA